MNSKVKVLLSVAAISFVMVGCGGGGSSGSSGSTDTAINSLSNAEGETSLGFYGSGVVIGSHSVGVNKYWNVTRSGYSGQVLLEMPDNGYELAMLDTTSGYTQIDPANYGVSSDGRIINIDENFDGVPDIRLELYTQIDSQTYDGYLSNPTTGEGFNITIQTTID